MHIMKGVGLVAFLLVQACAVLAAGDDPPQLPPDAQMSWLENDVIKLGIDLHRGGSIVYLAPKGGGNLINNYDLGRQVQLSFYAGPVPFSAGGQQPAEHWKHLGWNPIQAGDDFKNPSKIIRHENDGRMLHVVCRPMQWPLNNVPGDCTFESWLELDGITVKARARLNNARTDQTQYPARLQELPALYANGACSRVISYTGGHPFTNEAVAIIPRAAGPHPWSFWTGTECWSALLDENGRGIGLITPGRVHFTGGFAGKPSNAGTLGNSTGYLAGQALEILDHNIAFEFRYELVAGTLQQIRARAASARLMTLPGWNFAADRQGWHYANATDAGWPISGNLHVELDRNDPQLISPMTFWRAEDAPILIIECALRSKQHNATIMWQKLEESAFGKESSVSFSVEGDGEFHEHRIKLSDCPDYRAAMTRLRFDPVGGGGAGDWIKIKSIRLASAAH